MTTFATATNATAAATEREPAAGSTAARTLAVPAAWLAAATAGVSGVLQAVRSDDILFIDGSMHAIMALWAVMLLAQVVALRPLAVRPGSRWGWRALGTGSVLLAAAATASNVNGADFAWFPIVAAPANLLWLGGLIAIAVSAWRGELLHRGLAAALPLTWLGSIILAQMGGGVVVAIVWVGVAAQLARRGR